MSILDMLEGYKGLLVDFNSALKLSLESFGQMFLWYMVF